MTSDSTKQTTKLIADASPDLPVSESAELVESIARWRDKPGVQATACPALTLVRYDAPTSTTSYMHAPSICLIAQGSKRVLLGEETYVYDSHHFLLTSVDLPIIAQVTEASAKKPYLGLTLKLDPREIAQLMTDSSLPPPRTQQENRGMAVGKLSEPVLCAVLRLLDLLDEPEHLPILAPMIQRELLYRLLVGEQGPRLRQMGSAGCRSHQIARAIDWLKAYFAQPLRVDDLADQVRMSPSAFHHHFRTLTAMSPLQYQKWLRLHEARKLMLTEQLDASDAAFQVGYESPSQFSREYRRLFGTPPLRDIKSLRQTAGR
jgi:AraC-like DNA-binding protein